MPEKTSYSPRQRKSTILEMLKNEEEVKVLHLVEFFGVSGATVRSDLAEMEHSDLLQRVHGGAVSTKKAYYNMSLNDRMAINKNEKIHIAKACAGLINDGDTLMIDSGTTNKYVAMELAERKNLTIVTNAVQIAEEFVFNNTVNVILLGGNMNLKYKFTFGNDTVAQLQKYRADKMVLATDGISINHGLTTYHFQEADVSRCMIERSNSVIAVADHSKIGKEGFSYIAPLDSINTLVTDSNYENAHELDAFRSKGIVVEETAV